MDVVLVGLPGSGKSVVGRRLANRHGASLVDLDERIEAAAGRTISDVFAEDGEAGFRALERAAIVDLGPADPEPDVRRVISTGGGAVVDPRNRWALYRGRTTVWLDGRPEVLAQRLRRSPNVRPLVTGRDPIGTLRDLAARRERFYGATDIHQSGVAEVHGVVDAVEAQLGRPDRARRDHAAANLDADRAVRARRRDRGRRARHRAGRACVPGGRSWSASRAPGRPSASGWRPVCANAVARSSTSCFPQGEAAKRLEVVEVAARELAGLRVERSEPLVAVGGGALGDTAGFLAAVYLRGVRIIQVPTTLVAQIDSAIGGKTGVDLPEGKNLVGAFHQPSAVIIDIAMLRTLPERQMRAALGEAVKMAALGDERLFELLEADGPAIARGDEAVFASGVLAELVERAGWAKVEVVLADERERGTSSGRITLNLGHSLGHAFEAAGGYGGLLHGEAVAYGLRAASRIGVDAGVTPPERAARIGGLLDALGLATEPLPYPLATVMDHLATDKKHADGRLRWVLPTADGVVIRDDIDPALVERAAAGLLAAPSASPR